MSCLTDRQYSIYFPCRSIPPSHGRPETFIMFVGFKAVMDIAWILLIIAGFLEPCWVYTMERSNSFRDVKWAVSTMVIMLTDLYLLSVVMQTLGAGLSYAIWTGIGAVCTFLMGVVIYREPATLIRIVFIFMIIAGIVGLNLTSEAL